jgi:hypothetical protein
MRMRIFRFGAVAAILLSAWTANAGAISGYSALDLQIYQGSQSQNQNVTLVLNAFLGSPLGGSTSYSGPTIQGVLDQLKLPYSWSGSDFVGGFVGGKPCPLIVGLPGVNPIPEPRTWVLYALGALIGAWAIRKELRSS